MKYRVIEDSEEITVILEDGGIACIRENEGDGYLSVTDYYQTRFTQEMIDAGDIWEGIETPGQGKMYTEEWDTEYDNPAHIQDALEWLCMGCEFELDEDIWEDF